jgi:2-polyprenyl-3-methyl-5-hydroxy-6-metoxy-1,4-benzoquinol methylase
LTDYFQHDGKFQLTYADRRSSEIRVNQVAKPKLNWVLQQFGRVYNRKPVKILDVGAGSGHFVCACRQAGIQADGVEVSQQGVQFCKTNFGIELLHGEFRDALPQLIDDEYDLITFWGVIECVVQPLQMMADAVEIMAAKPGMIVAEVPRWDSFSTAIQQLFAQAVVRHLDPIAHVQIFTDFSFMKTFADNDLDLVAAWYFGMDAYEFTTQLAHALGDNRVISKMAHHIAGLQMHLDGARLSDEMVYAGIPKKHTGGLSRTQ